MIPAAAWLAPLVALAPGAAVPAAAPREAPTVLLLRPSVEDDVTAEATARVEGELRAAGFHVVVSPMGADPARAAVETAGAELAPVGAFAILVHGDKGGRVAEIWVSDRGHQRTVVERARLTDADRPRQSEILAVRAVELLKGSLAELWIQPPAPPPPPPAPPPPPPPPPPVVLREAPPVRAAFGAGVGVGIGAGVVAGFGAVGPVWLPSLVLSYGGEGGWSAQLRLHGLGPSVTLGTADGTATVDEQLASADVVKTWWPRWRVVPFVCAGVGAQHVHVRGTATAPFEGASADQWSALTSAGAGAAVPVYAGLSLVMQGRAAVAWPPAAVRIADVDVGRFGTPSLLVDADVLGVFP